MTSIAPSVLEGSSLVCRYEGAYVLREASIALQAGTMVVLLGASGSGKTSLLNILSGFIRPQAGQVIFDGMAVDPASLSWSTLSIVPQAVGLLGELTVAENIALSARLIGDRRDPPSSSELVKRLDLDQLVGRLPRQLSMGERQRTAVARALWLEPRVVLADEPTSHQDGSRTQVVLDVLREHCRRGATCLVASHDPVVVAAASRVLILEHGYLRAGHV